MKLWKITLPIDKNGTMTGVAMEVKPIPNNYQHPQYFYTAADGAMVFMAPTNGATTSGSKYPRSELREMGSNGKEYQWTTDLGGFMTAEVAVNEVPTISSGARGRVVIGQIHGPDDELCRLYYDNGVIYYYNDKAGPNGTTETKYILKSAGGAQSNIPMNAKFSYTIHTKGTKQVISAVYNGVTYSHTETLSSFWKSKALYFKAGVYVQVGKPGSAAGTTGTGQGKVSFYALSMTHQNVSDPGSGVVVPSPGPSPDSTPAPTPTPTPSPTPGSSPSVSGNTVKVSSSAQLNSAIASAKPGDSIILQAGTYNNMVIRFKANGTASAPVTLRALAPGDVKLTGSSYIIMEGQYLTVQGLHFTQGNAGNVIGMGTSTNKCLYCRLLNVKVDNQKVKKEGDSQYLNGNYQSSKWVQVHGQYNEIADSTFVGKPIRGALMVIWRVPGVPNYNRIHRNEFLDMPQLEVDGNEYEVIRIGESADSQSDSFTIVESNLFENCDGEVETVSSKSGSNIIRFNTFRNNAGMFTVRHGKNVVVEGNYFLAKNKLGSGGVRIVDSGHIVVSNHIQDTNGDNQFRASMTLSAGQNNGPLNGYYPVKKAFIGFNALIDNLTGVAIGVGKSELSVYPSDSQMMNNIVRPKSSQGVMLNKSANNAISFSGNLFDIGDLAVNGWSKTSLTTSLQDEVKVPSGAALSALVVSAAKLNQLGLSSDQVSRLKIKSGTIYDHAPVLKRGQIGARY